MWYLRRRSLRTVLSENDLNKDIAGIVKMFIPKNLIFFVGNTDPNNKYFIKIIPSILNLLGTEVKDVDNQKVELGDPNFFGLRNGTERLKLICGALVKKNLVVDTIGMNSCKLEVNYLTKMLCENSTVRELRLIDDGITNEGLEILAESM